MKTKSLKTAVGSFIVCVVFSSLIHPCFSVDTRIDLVAQNKRNKPSWLKKNYKNNSINPNNKSRGKYNTTGQAKSGNPSNSVDDFNVGRIAFISDRAGAPSLWIKKLGPNPQLYSLAASNPKYPAWSPNGKYLAYVSRQIGVSNLPVFSIRIKDFGTGDTIANFMGFALFGNTSTAEDVQRQIQHPQWSPDGKKIVFTNFLKWGERGLGLIEFQNPYDFTNYTTRELVPISTSPNALDATDPVFSKDGKYVYFHARNNFDVDKLYKVHINGGTPQLVQSNSGPVRRCFAPSVSPDGKKIIFNSELFKDSAPGYIGEEIAELNLDTGSLTNLTSAPGNQTGSYARNGNGQIVMESAQGTKGDIYLLYRGQQQKLDINDPTNHFHDYGPDWYIPFNTYTTTTTGGGIFSTKNPNNFQNKSRRNVRSPQGMQYSRKTPSLTKKSKSSPSWKRTPVRNSVKNHSKKSANPVKSKKVAPSWKKGN